MAVGAIIVLGVVLLQAVVSAANPEAPAQGVEESARGDVALRMLSGTGGSRIGVSIEEVETSEAASLFDEGAYVNEVRDGTPAAEAGLEAGDVVVEFDGERVRSAGQLSRLVQETPAGRAVSTTVIRDGSRQVLEVTPESGAGWMSMLRPDLDQLRHQMQRATPTRARGFNFSRDYFSGMGQGRLGVEVSSVSPQLADYFGVDGGVLVATVRPDSVASAAGLQAGDVITGVNAVLVDGMAALRRHVAALDPGEAFTVEITRDGREISLDGEIEEHRPARSHRREAIG